MVKIIQFEKRENNALWKVPLNIIGIALLIFGSYSFFLSMSIIFLAAAVAGALIIIINYNIYRSYENIRIENYLLYNIFKNNNQTCIILDNHLNIIFLIDNMKFFEKQVPENLNQLTEILSSYLISRLAFQLYENELFSFEKNVRTNDNRFLKIDGSPFIIREKFYYLIQISEIKYSQYNENNLVKKLLDCSDIPFMVLNEYKQVKYINSGFCRLFNMANTVLDRSYSKIVEESKNTINNFIGGDKQKNPDYISLSNANWEQISSNGNYILYLCSNNIKNNYGDDFYNCPISIINTDLKFNVINYNAAAEGIISPFISHNNKENTINFLDIIKNHKNTIVSQLQVLSPEEIISKFSVQNNNQEKVMTFNFVINKTLEYYKAFLIPKYKNNIQEEWGIFLYNNKEQHETEQKLLHLQRLSNIGQLMGQIIHDTNNNLTAALCFCDLLSNNYSADTVEKIKSSIGRAVNLSKKLLSSCKKDTPTEIVKDINNSISDLLYYMGRLIGENIKLEFNKGENILPVAIDETRFEQIANNLILNARDAMTTGGIIKIRTENIFVGETLASENNVEPGEYILFSVKDTGIGIPIQNIDKVSEAFFTTKEKGTGIGLYTVNFIIKNYLGFIQIHSEENKGTEFLVYLPKANYIPDNSTENSIDNINSNIENTSEDTEDLDFNINHINKVILVVEDELNIKQSIVEGIVKCGYTVIEACSGEEILNKIETENISKADIVVTDIILAGITGLDLQKKLKLKFPNIKVIFTSGYDMSSYDIDSNDIVLPKPFEFRKLKKIIFKALNNSSKI